MNILEKAKDFARTAHNGQTRKLSNQPYYTHTEGVAKILSESGLSHDVIVAGFLHDIVEDTSIKIDTIREQFGDKVAEYVLGNTEDKLKSWEERKSNTIEALKTASFEIKCLIAADKLDNLRSMIFETNKDRNRDIWSHFKRGREEQGWYFKGVTAALFENIEEEKIPEYFYTLRKSVQEYFQ